MKLKGFTLVELLVVIAMLGVLIGISLSYIRPQLQVNKINDATRKTDLEQTRTALDTYYNDHGCYPTSLNFGSSWSEGGSVYMKKVPQDPECGSDPSKCYVYKYAGSCPQWNVLFSKLTKPPTTGNCELASMSSCVPQDYSSSWACIVSGTVSCASLSTSSLSSGSTGGSPAPTQGQGGINPTVTPTPTPPSGCSPKNYSCTGNPAHCNVVPGGTGQYCNASCNGVC